MESPKILGTTRGHWLVVKNDETLLGRWNTQADADAHAGEHQAMDPEADLSVYRQVDPNCLR
jgi:hypothetical protein